jgi:hypothetical protein
MAELSCKVQKLSAAAATDPAKAKEVEATSKEITDLGASMAEKYKNKLGDKDMAEKAAKIMADVMANCK